MLTAPYTMAYYPNSRFKQSVNSFLSLALMARPQSGWNWVQSTNIQWDEVVEKALDKAPKELNANQTNKDQVSEILRNIAQTMKSKGMEEAAMATCLKGLKSYHKVSHIAYVYIAKAVYNVPGEQLRSSVRSALLSRRA